MKKGWLVTNLHYTIFNMSEKGFYPTPEYRRFYIADNPKQFDKMMVNDEGMACKCTDDERRIGYFAYWKIPPHHRRKLDRIYEKGNSPFMILSSQGETPP